MNLFGGECCAERCHHISKPGLMHGNHIGITFHDIALVELVDIAFGLRDPVNGFSLLKDGGFRLIEILGMVVVKGASAKSHHLSRGVENGKDNPTTKFVEPIAMLIARAKSHFL